MRSISLRSQATLAANALRNLASGLHDAESRGIDLDAIRNVLNHHAEDLERAVRAEEQPIVSAASHRSDESHDPEPER